MRKPNLLLLLLISFAALSSSARAASITVDGVVGAPGADGVDGLGTLPPAEAGGAGGDASAVANAPDPTNTAVANGGDGGAGGNGGDSTGPAPGGLIFAFGGNGGDGGAGGAAVATANASVASGPAQAFATSAGGNGAEGAAGGSGVPGPDDGFYAGGSGGKGGAGGSALADASSAAASGAALASARAAGGSGAPGGVGGTGRDLGALMGGGGVNGDAEANSIAIGRDGASAEAEATAGDGLFVGDNPRGALATADASSSEGTASATANALGGHTDFGEGTGAEAHATASAEGSSDAIANSRATGGRAGTDRGAPISQAIATSAAFSQGGSAEAHASAATDGTAEASATAEAFGGAAAFVLGTPPSAPGGEQIATATATSQLGDATAIARQTAGDGSSGSVGPLVSGPVYSGGPGASSTMLDAVTGGAGGLLTLVQEARGGDAGLNATGGAARSELLLAENLLGGELVAVARAVGGSFQEPLHSNVNSPPIYVSSGGGAASAIVVATDTQGQRVEGHASAEGGRGNIPWDGLATRGGEALSYATARGLGQVLARADATTHSAVHANANSSAETLGPIAGARSALDLIAADPHPSVRYQHWTRRVETEAGIGVAASIGGTALPSFGERHARLFAAPLATDVTTWALGNPTAEAALADSEVLALGSLAASSELDDDAHLTGSLALDLDAGSFDGSTQLALAFLDPTAVGEGIDLLHLRFSVDGVDVFDESFEDTASALAGLDDALIELGALGDSDDALRTLVMSFELDFLDATETGAFAFDFVLLAKAGVPEPTAALLLACFGALLLAVRRARSV